MRLKPCPTGSTCGKGFGETKIRAEQKGEKSKLGLMKDRPSFPDTHDQKRVVVAVETICFGNPTIL